MVHFLFSDEILPSHKSVESYKCIHRHRRNHAFDGARARKHRGAPVRGQLQRTNLVGLTFSRNGSRRTSILLTGIKLTLFSCFTMALITPPERVRQPLKGIDILCYGASTRSCLATYRSLPLPEVAAPMLPICVVSPHCR